MFRTLRMVGYQNITENAKDKAIEVKVVVEDFRFYFYLVFCLITFTGWILTTFYTKDFFGCDKYGNLLSDVFGSVNLCVVFDFPPATYILPSLYSVLVVFVYLFRGCDDHTSRSDFVSGC